MHVIFLFGIIYLPSYSAGKMIRESVVQCSNILLRKLPFQPKGKSRFIQHRVTSAHRSVERSRSVTSYYYNSALDAAASKVNIQYNIIDFSRTLTHSLIFHSPSLSSYHSSRCSATIAMKRVVVRYSFGPWDAHLAFNS